VKRAAFGLGIVWVALEVALPCRAQQGSATLFVFHDSDRTTVVSPRAQASARFSDTRVDVMYTADIWTSASIDIRTSASKPITEQRDELGGRVRQTLGDTTLDGSYRFSIEPDYVSHGAALGLDQNFADNSTTLALSAHATVDRVGRAGDPAFDEPAQHAGLRASWTQILDRYTFVQLVDEAGYSHGYLSSPYRFVGLGSGDGSCREPSRDCLRENNPDSRLRNAVALIARRALSDQVSTGLSYRFYSDSWRLLSHTLEADVSWAPNMRTRLALRYRLYGQTAAVHYAPRFVSRAGAGRYYSRDKELSPLISQRLSLEFERTFELSPSQRLRLVAAVGPSLYVYSDFPPFRRLQAIDGTLSLVLEL
jgi:hypothetical protein